MANDDNLLSREHNAWFTHWLKNCWYGREPTTKDEKVVKLLSQGPVSTIVTLQSYDINGYTFHAEAQDQKSLYHNSGITLEAKTSHHGSKYRYFDVIKEIWEIYYTVKKIPMFHTQWAKDVKVEDEDFTTVIIPSITNVQSRPIKQISLKEEPLILAKQAAQVVFTVVVLGARSMSTSSKLAIRVLVLRFFFSFGLAAIENGPYHQA